MSFWQHGRFEPQPEFDLQSSHFVSLECPDAAKLYALQQQDGELEPDLVLIRLACDARMQKTQLQNNFAKPCWRQSANLSKL